MRFVWAVVAFVLAALMIGAGIAQRTVFERPTSASAQIEVSGDAPYILIDGAVLNNHDGAQTLRVQEDGTIFAAYGRTSDLEAWLTKADYTHVTEGAEGIETADIAASDPPAADAEPLSPVDSDLWLDQFEDEDVLIRPLQLPDDMSLIVATDGVAAAPSSLTVTWPVRSLTPWAGPLIIGGSIVLAAGIVLYLLGVRHARRSKGPRRKGLPMPATEPIDVAVDGADKGVISASPTRKQLPGGKRTLIAVPAVAVSALLFTGCTADAWPDLAGSPTPSASATVVIPDDQGAPVVTDAQAERIVARIATQVAAADESLDPAAAAERLDGTALATRETDYRLRAALPDQAAPAAIPSGELDVILPEANDGWPRTFLAVAPGGADASDVVMSVTQQDAWSPYKLTYIADLVTDPDLKLAPSYVGAIPIPADSPFLTVAPEDLAAAYADVLTNGEDSEYASAFELDDDPFRALVDTSRADRLAQFNETGASTGALAFSAEAGITPPVALATLDSGAIVAVTVNDLDTVTPTNPDAVIKVDGNPTVQTLAGESQSATGFTTTFANQLFFFVPSQSSNERIRLLGYMSDILDAKAVS